MLRNLRNAAAEVLRSPRLPQDDRAAWLALRDFGKLAQRAPLQGMSSIRVSLVTISHAVAIGQPMRGNARECKTFGGRSGAQNFQQLLKILTLRVFRVRVEVARQPQRCLTDMA